MLFAQYQLGMAPGPQRIRSIENGQIDGWMDGWMAHLKLEPFNIKLHTLLQNIWLSHVEVSGRKSKTLLLCSIGSICLKCRGRFVAKTIILFAAASHFFACMPPLLTRLSDQVPIIYLTLLLFTHLLFAQNLSEPLSPFVCLSTSSLLGKAPVWL